MGTALCRQESGDIELGCPIRGLPAIAWQQDLPSSLMELVVAPIRFKVAQEYEMAADHTKGYDQQNNPCYCAFRHVRTQLRSDDDEVFYEAPVYAEMLTSWKLEDERWLILREIIGNFELGQVHSHFSLSESMPR